ncbi:hypothetical protein BC941DRAFT_437321 [Chlamydoabsidia padenii]|nr:hypothetical protein BC941DRAFT_437321 [Chlamydoabsidia padenii]
MYIYYMPNSFILLLLLLPLLILAILISSITGQQIQEDPSSICISLQHSTACPAFHQFYVSAGVVDRYPFLPSNITTIQELDNGLLNYVNSSSDYLLPLGCLSTNYNPTTPYARYALTKMCARLIQDAEDSLPCNTEHNVIPPPLCQTTCLDWVNSITTITAQPQICSDNSQRTSTLANYTSQCLYWQGYNATADDNCISGFANEPENCGFRDNTKEACRFCQNTTNAASSNCCQLVTCGNGLGIASIIGIIFGILVTLILVLLCSYCLCKRYVWSKGSSRKVVTAFSTSSTSINNNNHKNDPSSNSSSYSTDSKTAIHPSSKHWSTILPNSMTSTCIPSPVSLQESYHQQEQYHYHHHHHHHLQPQQQLYSTEEALHVVKYAYPPQMGDELALNVGDIIMVALPFDDGWALGVNKTTGLKGAFPMVCVSPTTIMESPLGSNDTSSIPKRMESSSSSDHVSPFI